MGTFFLESSVVVNLAMICVMSVAKAKCQVVRTMGKWNLAVSRIHLLKMMTLELRVIHVLRQTRVRTDADAGKVELQDWMDSHNVDSRM